MDLSSWCHRLVGRGALEARARHRDAAVAVIGEIVRAPRADGVELDEAVAVRVLDGAPAGMRSWMQKDAEAGRPIELDAIGGAILRAADRTGVPAPVTGALVTELRDR